VSTEQNTPWRLIVIALTIGIVGAFYVGKTPPALPLMRDELKIGLVTAGWIVSIFSLIGTGLGIGFGLLTDRLGHGRMMALAMLLMAGGGVWGGLAQSSFEMLISRALEGAGYIGLMIATPSLIAQIAAEKDRLTAVSFWSSVTPIGMTIAIIAAPWVITQGGWRNLWLLTAILSLVFLVVAMISFRRHAPPKKTESTSHWQNVKLTTSRPGPWILTICFSTYTFQWMAMMVWLPTFAIEEKGLSLEIAATLTAIALAINIPGNWFGTWLVHKQILRWLLITLGSGIMGTTALLAFPDWLPDGIRYLLVLVFSFCGGMQPAAILGGAPVHSPSPAQLGTTNGLIYQGSQGGQLIGPPIVAFVVVQTGAWDHAGWVLLALTGINLILAQWIRRLEHS
jgi:MFS family permease